MSAKFKILITDDVHPSLLKGLKRNEISYTFKPEITWDDTKSIIHAYHGIVINTKTRMNEEMLNAAEKLALIIRLGSGLDIIDLTLAEKMQISVFNTPQGNANAVGEHALAMLLSLFNKICKSSTEVRSMQWKREENRGVELDGKTIGIIGFGNTGPAFARKLRGFDVEILVYDKYKQHFGNKYRYIRETTLTDILENADVISLHIPLTEETEGYVDASFFNRCKKDVYLINTSRGKIINTRDLIQKVESGKLKGVCLDVLENEKPFNYSADESLVYKRLFEMEKVLITPHIAGWTHESKRKIAEESLEKIIEFNRDNGFLNK